MSNVAPPPELLRAPADRPAGKRGARGFVAAVAALAGLVPLMFLQNAGESAWARPGLGAGSVALLAGAVLLWTARRRMLVAGAAVAVATGAMLAALAIAAERSAESARLHEEERLGGAVLDEPVARGPRLTRAEARAVPIGLTRQELRSTVGPPASYGIQRVTDGPDMRCWAYRSLDRHPRWPALHAFCFRDGRYAELTRW